MWSHRREVTEPGSRNLNIVGEEGKRRKQRSQGSEWSRGCCRPGRLAPLSPALVSSWVFWPQEMFQGKRCFTSPIVKKCQLKPVYWSKKNPLLVGGGVEGWERSGEQPGNRIRILNENVLRPNSWACGSSVTYWLTLEIAQYHFFQFAHDRPLKPAHIRGKRYYIPSCNKCERICSHVFKPSDVTIMALSILVFSSK